MDSRTSALHVPHPSAVAAKTEEPPREALLFHVVNQLVRVHESLARRCGTASGPAYPPPHEDVHERRRALLCELYSSCLSPLFAEAPSSRHARDARPPEDHTPRWASRSMATMFSETEAAPVVPVGSPQPAVVSSFTTSATTGSPPRRLKRRFTSKSCSRCTTNLTSQWRSGPAGPSTLCNACGIRHRRALLKVQHHRHHPHRPSPIIKGTASADPPQRTPPQQATQGKRSDVHFLLNHDTDEHIDVWNC